MSLSERLHSALVDRDHDAEQEMAPEVRRHVAPNGVRLVTAQALQSSGDQSVNASTVLPWLFSVLGVPTALTGLLVPIRESGSMLPQAFLTPLVLRVRHRKWVFVTGALVQSAAVAVMAAAAALGQGLGAGVVIVAALAVFSLGRCLCSIASKDVQGRTVPRGQRGQITGLATTAAGFVAITLGLGIRFVGGDDLSAGQLAWILAGGSVFWVAVAAIYAGVREPADEPLTSPTEAKARQQDDQEADHWFATTAALLREDKDFRGFVGVRSLLLVSSLSPPFVVALSLDSGVDSLAGLGGFVIASGLAALIGGRLFGRMADRSSKRVMTLGAGFASAVIIATITFVALLDLEDTGWAGEFLFIAAYFTLTLTHTGVRVGRKTYVVDMAEGDRRTTYVAVSNSAMGLVLLVVGALSSALAAIHVFWALGFLAAMGLAGVVAGSRLPDVSRG